MSNDSFSLTWKDGHLWFQGPNDMEAKKAKALFARPISGWGEEVSILDHHEQSELLWIESLKELSSDLQQTLKIALEKRYGIFQISKIIQSEVNFGNRIVEVETQQGRRVMNVVSAWKNVINQKDGSVIIRDAVGNRYRIPNPQNMDLHSQALFNSTF
jgi:hypothetical protein